MVTSAYSTLLAISDAEHIRTYTQCTYIHKHNDTQETNSPMHPNLHAIIMAVFIHVLSIKQLEDGVTELTNS